MQIYFEKLKITNFLYNANIFEKNILVFLSSRTVGSERNIFIHFIMNSTKDIYGTAITVEGPCYMEDLKCLMQCMFYMF